METATATATIAVDLRESVHRYLEWLTDAVYAMGYQDALRDVATRHAELDAAWQPIGRLSYEEKLAARAAEMQQAALRFQTEM